MLWGTLDRVILGNVQFVIQVRIIFYVIRLCCVVTLSVRTVKLCHVCHTMSFSLSHVGRRVLYHAEFMREALAHV